MFLPMMACRLMLSLKKAATEPRGLWSLSNDRERAANETIEFVPPTFEMSCENSDTLAQPSEEDIELGVVPDSPRKDVSPC